MIPERLECLRRFMRRQYSLGKFLWVRSTWRFLRQVWEFYPIYRLKNYLFYKFLLITRQYHPLTIGTQIRNGVFYICLDKNATDPSILKIPHLNRIASCELFKRLNNVKSFNEYARVLRSLENDPTLGKHLPSIKSIRRDGGYYSSYVKGYNLILMRDMIRDKQCLPSEVTIPDLSQAIDQLLGDLHIVKLKNGHLAGDWGLHNLIYEQESKIIRNVDLEGFFMYSRNNIEADMGYIEGELSYIKEILNVLSDERNKSRNVLKILSVLEEIKKSDVAYNGAEYSVGYHSLNLGDKYFRGQRECASRLASVPYDFTNKVVVDLGCNCGGMLHCLADKIYAGIGLDYDPRCINAANLIKNFNCKNNLHFFVFDLNQNIPQLINNYILTDKVDICFMLSISMWLRDWKNDILYCKEIADSLLFESNGEEREQKEQQDFLYATFDKIKLLSAASLDDPSQKLRKLYLCQKCS